jgi:hypothetical protein
MGDWFNATFNLFGTEKAYGLYEKVLVGTRYKGTYKLVENTTELCGSCHSNDHPRLKAVGSYSEPGWPFNATSPNSPHGFPAAELFVGSWKQTGIPPSGMSTSVVLLQTFECTTCHYSTMTTYQNGTSMPQNERIRGHSFQVNTTILMNGTACSSCHYTGGLIGNLSTTIETIETEIHNQWNGTNASVMAALNTIKAYQGAKIWSRDNISIAYWNLRLVSSDGSWGNHNPAKARALLNEAEAKASESLAMLGQGPPFSDVPNDFWGRNSIAYLLNRSVTSGYPDGTFRPNNQITRAEIAVFVVMGMNYTLYNGTAVNFSDVHVSDWFYPYVMTAYVNGIVGGYGDGTFKPNQPVTRAEISAMVAEAANLTYNGSGTNFSDVPGTFWGYPYIMAVKQYGIVSGYPDGTFQPNNQATRAEASAMVSSMMQLP